MNDFDSAKVRRDGGVDLVNSRFNSRVRRSPQQVSLLSSSVGNYLRVSFNVDYHHDVL